MKDVKEISSRNIVFVLGKLRERLFAFINDFFPLAEDKSLEVSGGLLCSAGGWQMAFSLNSGIENLQQQVADCHNLGIREEDNLIRELANKRIALERVDGNIMREVVEFFSPLCQSDLNSHGLVVGCQDMELIFNHQPRSRWSGDSIKIRVSARKT